MKDNRFSIRCSPRLMILLALVLGGVANAFAYDPLLVDATHKPETLELTVHDDARKRDIPIFVYLPANPAPQPVVLFSHGLGGSRHGSAFMGVQWAERGYVAVFVQHPGSDESVWQGKPLLTRMQSMKQAASLENFLLRVRDIPAVLDQLEKWNHEKGHRLEGRMNLKKIGMSGHSFGAVTTEAVSGQSIDGRQPYTDARITAAIACSPSVPKRGIAAEAFGSVKIPWMLLTGTADASPIGNTTPESRRKVYPALPPGDKYELVLNKAEHSVFTQRALPGEHEARNPNHHRSILAMSTAFWDAYLREDAAAKAWLNSASARSVLEPEDQWQYK